MNKPAPINNNEDKISDNDSGIIVCGVCKNVASTLPVIRAAFEDLVKKAGVPCWAMFYENNSDDGTDAELMKWASEMPDRVKVKCEKIPREEELARGVARTYDNKPCRMEQIAHARNKLLDMLIGELPGNQGSPHPSSSGNYVPRTPSPSGDVPVHTVPIGGAGGFAPRYVVMIDMDNPVPFPVNAIIRCIARDPDGFDALVCNGLNPMGYMYDFYAYRDAQFPFGPEIMREGFWSGHHQCYVQNAMHNKTMLHNRQLRQNPVLLPYIPIGSGFNGMCIFRRDAIQGVRYSAVPTPEMNAEYEAMKCIPSLSKNAKTHVDGASVGMYLFPKNEEDKGIFYFHNSGYNFPVVCEHVPFFAGMRAHNRRRIYLCTDLVWNWI
jgi:hypothetical protein